MKAGKPNIRNEARPIGAGQIGPGLRRGHCRSDKRESNRVAQPNNIAILARISFAKRRIGYREKLGASDEIIVLALRSLV